MDSAPSPESTSSWFVKTVRSGARDESGNLPPEVWQQGGVSPTLSTFDNNSEARATVLTTITARYGKGADSDGQGVIAHALTAEGHDASEDGTGRGTPIVAFAWQAGGNNDASGAFNTDGTMPTLPKSQTIAIHEATTVRRLTPRECERLMGWPDDHTRYRLAPDGTVVEQADSNRYRQCGNGMAAPVVAWIARRIVTFEEA